MNEKDYLILWIASEILVTAIIFVAAFYILKPYFSKGKSGEDEAS